MSLRGGLRVIVTVVGLALFVAVTVSAQPAAPATITGTVYDQTGAVLPGAAVDLVNAVGGVVHSTTTDAVGAFRFDAVSPGQYELRATYEGFTRGTMRVRAGNGRGPGPQKLVLDLAGVNQDVTVGTGAAEVQAGGAANQDAVTLDQNLLRSLPVFDQDVVATISRFLDPAAAGNGGVTVVVNGMEVSAVNITASAIQQIKINQDPYSAEFSRPGRGRIEILTRPGTQQYHGEGNTIFRDARLNARNAFAATRPPEQRRIFEGSLSGPVRHSKTMSFLLSAQDNTQAQQAAVFAIGAGGLIRDNVPQPNREALVTGSLTLQRGTKNTISIRPAYQYESNLRRGVGGVTLASAGTDFRHHEQQVTYTQQTIFRPTLVNQFQILAGHEREPTTNVSDARGIVVAGAFTGGGAQAELLRTERHIQMTESLAWTSPHHLVQTGVQLPDWSRRGFDDRTDVGGTYYFASLDAYNAGLPYSYTQQQGDGRLVFLEKQVGWYIKDDWQVRPGLSLSAGLRYDWQNYFHDNNNFAPRVSLAFAPARKKGDVFRIGAGLFTDRSGPVVINDLRQYQTGRLTRIVINDPPFPDPFAGSTGQSDTAASAIRLAPDVQIPQTFQYSAGVDHQLRKGTTLSVTYTGSRGSHLFRSRDINAPLPPLYLARPDPDFGAVREVESNGRQRSDSLQLSARGAMTSWFTGQLQYSWSRLDNDTNGIASYPANDYDLAGEWGRGDQDRRQRFALLGRLHPTHLVDAGVSVSLNSGAPYSEMIGQDVYNNGRGRARPAGVPRNTLQGPGFAALDLRIARELTIGKGRPDARSLTVGLDAFNVLNRVNYTTVVGTIDSPLFGRPIGARDPRQLQVSARVTF